MSATLDPALRNGIGASEIAMLFGLSPYGGPLALYQRIVAPEDRPATTAQRRGTRAERFIAEEYAERHGLFQTDFWAGTRDGVNALWCPPTQRHVAHDFLIASPDRIEFRGGTPVRVVEIKTARNPRGWQDPDDAPDGAPAHYLMQVGQQMMVGLDGTPIEQGVIVASVGHHDDYREYRVERNVAVEHAIVEKAGAFWHDHVLPKRPPEWDGSPAGDALLRALYPSGLRADPLPATDEVGAVMAALRHARAVRDEAERAEAALEQAIKAAIGDGPGFASESWRVTWHQNKPTKAVDRAAAIAELLADPAVGPVVRAVLDRHTETKAGARVFRPRWDDE